jgi:type VI secretion system protein ImpC
MTDKQTAPQQAGELVEVKTSHSPRCSASIAKPRGPFRRERNRTRDLIGELVNQVLEGEMTPSRT